MTKLTLDLVITKEDNTYKGSLTYNDNPLTQTAPSVPGLETQLKKLLWEFESLDPDTVAFNHYYDCPSFFKAFEVFKLEKLAKLTNLDPEAMKAFASGAKKPSPEEAEKIEKGLQELASRLMKTSLVLS